MIQQLKSSIPDSANHNWIGSSHHSYSTIYGWQGLPKEDTLDQFIFVESRLAETEFEVGLSCESQRSKRDSRSELDSLKQALAGLIMFLTITVGLYFVVGFMWTFVMESAGFSIYDLTGVIRGHR